MEITKVHINGVKHNPKTMDDYIDIYWQNEELEFGHIGLYSSFDGKIVIDSEYMRKEFIKQVFEKLIDDAELKD
jgi:hypothetical protein